MSVRPFCDAIWRFPPTIQYVIINQTSLVKFIEYTSLSIIDENIDQIVERIMNDMKKWEKSFLIKLLLLLYMNSNLYTNIYKEI